MSDLIPYEVIIERVKDDIDFIAEQAYERGKRDILEQLQTTPTDHVLCKDCKYWIQQTNYAGAPLSFGFCESDEMWRSLYGETCEVSHIDTDDDFYCGYAERRTE